MDLVFFGSSPFGLPTLQALMREHTVRTVVSQPDRPAGRRRKLTPTPIAAWADQHHPGVPVIKADSVNVPEVRNRIREIQADAWVVIAFGQKLGTALLADRFAINLHGSLLPRWRGAAPINAALLAGDAEIGNTVITLADRMDAGLILANSAIEVQPSMTAGDAHDRLAELGTQDILRVLDQQERGTLNPRVQDEASVTIAPKLSRADAWVDFEQPAEECRRRINALSPRPGVTVTLESGPEQVQLKLLRAADDPISDPGTPARPGVLINPRIGLVRCGQGTSLRLHDVQPANKPQMAWGPFFDGRNVRPGDRLISPERPHQA